MSADFCTSLKLLMQIVKTFTAFFSHCCYISFLMPTVSASCTNVTTVFTYSKENVSAHLTHLSMFKKLSVQYTSAERVGCTCTYFDDVC